MCARDAAKRSANAIKAAVSTFSWPSLITLTLQHDAFDSLKSLLQKLQLAWKRFLQTDCRDRITAGIRVTECTRGEGGWHAHLHLIVDCQWMPADELRAAWKRATGGSHVVDVRRLKSKSAAATYVAKYVSKAMPDLADHDRIEWVEAMKGLRTTATFGDLRGTRLTIDPEDLPEFDQPREGERKLGSLTSIMHCANLGQGWALIVMRSLFPKEYPTPRGREPDPPDPSLF
jgi:hypothetical protein